MINLLSPQYKKELKKEKRFKVIIALNLLILFFMLTLSGIFFLTKISLEQELKAQHTILKSDQEKEKLEKVKSLENEISNFNKTIGTLENYYENYFNIVRTLELFSSTLPNNTYTNSITITRSEEENIIAQVKAQGYCPDRERLKSFDSNLNKKEEFIEINFAKENWTKPSEINFSVNFKIKNGN